jgi:hypothetical protein
VRRRVIAAKFRGLAARWPWLRTTGAPGPQTRLGYADTADPRLRLGTRQGVGLLGTYQGYTRLRARTALKLAACGGLTATDLFVRLRCDDVGFEADNNDPLRMAAARLMLPPTVRAHSAERAEVTVWAQDDAELCGVTALVEWLLLLEAAQGHPPAGTDPVFPTNRRWRRDGAGHTSLEQADKDLRAMQLRVGIDPPYTWASVRELYVARMVAQSGNELSLHAALRLRKIEHVHRASIRHRPPGHGHVTGPL